MHLYGFAGIKRAADISLTVYIFNRYFILFNKLVFNKLVYLFISFKACFNTHIRASLFARVLNAEDFKLFFA